MPKETPKSQSLYATGVTILAVAASVQLGLAVGMAVLGFGLIVAGLLLFLMDE